MIYQFWMGEKPSHIEFAQWTVHATAGNVPVLHIGENMGPRILEEREESLARHPAMIADYLRAEFVVKGGLWLDSDFVAFSSPVKMVDELLQKHPEKEAVLFFDSYARQYDNDFMFFKRECYTARTLFSHVHERIFQKEPLVWGSLGAKLLNPLMQDPVFYTKVAVVGPEQVSWGRSLGLSWDADCPDEFLNLPPECVGLQLMNSSSGEYLSQKSIDEWRDSETMFGACVRTAEKRIGRRFVKPREKP